jgi:hypothetical protein
LYVRSPAGVLGRLDLLPSLAAKDTDEASHGVRLPARGFHDLGERGALRALHHGDYLRLLVGALALGLPAAFLALLAFGDLVFFVGLAAPLGFAVSGAGLLMFSLSIALSLIGFSLTELRS